MHPDFTNIYIVGGAHVLSIDSGEAIDRYRWMLRGYLAATERAEIAMAGITHHHSDHSGNLKWVREVLDADVVVPKKAIPLLRGRLPKERVEILDLDRPITLEGGPRVQVLATPGHSVDSVCYYVEEEGVLFTGDTLLGSSTTTVHDLRDYRRTLQHLLGLPNLRVICPGHGPLVHDPRERLQSYVDHRNMRERQILQVIEKKGAVTSWEIMMELYPEIDKRLRRAADNNVRSHLVQLEHEGRLKVYPGKPGKPDVKKRQKDVEHAKYRRDIIKKAQKFEAEDRRAEIRAQENPPTAEWRQPPRYELIGTARE
jgi:glyoxylase-like metal-dependent hydrolase (beta-lactamase superfamily II)